ncbi:sigma-54 interaction domain-containing protein [Pseudogemmobacter sonorensis]|uniref:sigma-54 interaction domain-containing protein n=1 Tax=Pseudogemmobacter sonorensis TaxID=2989681 RepID=UPI0036C7D495
MIAGGEHAITGIVLMDAEGRIQQATGIGEDLRIRALVMDPAWMAELRERRIMALTLDRQGHVLLLAPHSHGEMVVISCPPGNALLDFIGSVDFAYDVFSHLVADPFEAMTVVDAKGRLVFISPVHERFFGLSPGGGNGRAVRDVIENTRLDRVLAEGKAEVGVLQKIGDTERVVSRIPIRREGRVVGAIGRVMFKGPRQVEDLLKRISTLESEVQFYRRETQALRSNRYGLESLVGNSPAMQRLRAEIAKVAPLEIPVHIRGESGTGKELVAHAIHRLSPRRDTQMVTLNSAALPATLVEAELFGYESGAFTGADRKGRKGKFEQADKGTIFLDEIGDTPPEVQVKLLRVLQDRRIERIGGGAAREVDFRLVTATNRDLREMIAEEKFRLDLYYRISAIVIDVPPLRRRIDDIPALVDHTLKDLCSRYGQPLPRVTQDALDYLMDQHWPGNVRQLRHETERALVFCEGGVIDADTLIRHSDQDIVPGMSSARARPAVVEEDSRILPMRDMIEDLEKKAVARAMERFGGNKRRVAETLGISRSYLYKLLGAQDDAAQG